MRNEWIYATPAQENYLDFLYKEAAKLRCAPWVPAKRRLLKSEASQDITAFKKAIEQAKEKK